MTLLRRFLVCALVWGAFSVTAGGAAARTTGATCFFSPAPGSNTSFTLTLNSPAGEPTLGGLAFGATGVTIVIIVVDGHSGTMSTNNLPQGMSNELLFNSNPLTSGAIYTVHLTTNVPFTGTFFNVAGANFPPTLYFPTFPCLLATGTAGPPPAAVAPNNQFTTGSPIYNTQTGLWYLPANGPGGGEWQFNQFFAPPPPRWLAAAAGVDAAKPLIQSGRVVAKRAGKVKLPLRPTAAGKAILKQKGFLKVRLKITFTPTGGKPASKIVSLTLRAKK